MGRNQGLAPNLRTFLSIPLAIYIVGNHEMFPTANTWGLIAGALENVTSQPYCPLLPSVAA